MNPLKGTLAEWRTRLRSKEISPAELAILAADAIESETTCNAFLPYNRERAIQLANQVDLNTPLAGLPIAIKDNINVLGQPMRCASKMLSPFVSPYDATSISYLKQAGGIPLGRTNMDEFAMGASGENSAFGVTRNPKALQHIPGGSSSGSAAAVASGTAIAALGSDTGGSIRQPAGHCGIVGLKPTYGRVSRYGLVAYASSLDQIGPMTQTVEDAAILLQAISGYDTKDSTSIDHPIGQYEAALKKDIKGLKIGIPKEYMSSGNHPAVTESLNKAIKELESLGAEVIEISLPHSEAVVAAYYIISCAEASSNLSRFDGIRYGHRSENYQDILSLYSQSREEGFGPEVKRRIILGTYVLSSGYYDAYYTKALKVRNLISKDFNDAFAKVDLVLGPVSPTPAPMIGAAKANHLQTYLADIYTIPSNLTGLPGISIPYMEIEEDGASLPIGIQFVAPHFREDLLIQIGSALEK